MDEPALPANDAPQQEPPPKAEVWLIQLPKSGFSWFTGDSERVQFWKGRGDAVITAYTRIKEPA